MAEEGGGEEDEEEGEEEDQALRMQGARLLCEQLCLADVVLLNKLDLVSAEEADDAERSIAAVNATAKLVRCRHAKVPLELVLDLHAFSLERAIRAGHETILLPPPDAVEDTPGARAFSFAARPPQQPSREPPHERQPHLHDQFASLGLESDVELDELSFTDWLEAVFASHRKRLYRAKGIVFFRGVEEATTVQCVGAHVECERMAVQVVQGDEPRRSRLVFIGRTRGIEASLRDGWNCLQEGP